MIYYECGHSHGPLLSNIVGNQSEINFLITCLFSISIYRYILASPGGMQSPFLRLGLSPAATATARWRNRASIAIYPWKQDQYISWSEIVFTYCGDITNVQATSESVCYLSFWRDRLTCGLHRRYSVFLWYFLSYRYQKIPSEMEVAPRYNCWHPWHCRRCWHCSTLFDTVDMTYNE